MEWNRLLPDLMMALGIALFPLWIAKSRIVAVVIGLVVVSLHILTLYFIRNGMFPGEAYLWLWILCVGVVLFSLFSSSGIERVGKFLGVKQPQE